MNSKLRRSGFSLVELLVALVIAGVLGGGLTLAFRTALDANQKVHSRADGAQEARIILNTLRADVEHATLAANSERSWFIGTDENDGDRDVDSLRIVTRSHRVPLRDVAAEAEWESLPRHADWSAVTYSLAPAGTSEEAGLFRREEVPPGLDPFEEVGEDELLSPSVVGINCRYFDGTDWLDSWDTTAEGEVAGLPRLVEVAVTFRTDPESEETRTVTGTFAIRAEPPADAATLLETEVSGSGDGGALPVVPGGGSGAPFAPGGP